MTINNDKRNPAEMLTIYQLAAALGVSEQTIRRYWRAGRLPEPVRFNSRTIRWPRDVLRTAIL